MTTADSRLGPADSRIAVEIDEPTRPRRRRLPSDLLRFLVGGICSAIGAIVLVALDDVSVGLTLEVIDAAQTMPEPVVVTVILFVQLITWAIPIVTAVVLLVQRTYRRLALASLAVVSAAAVAWVLDRTAFDRFAVELVGDVPGWICAPGDERLACVPGDGFPSAIQLAAFAAGFSALAPWLGRRWRRAGAIALVAFVVVRTIDGIVAPVEAVVAVAVGYTIGAGVVLAFGVADPRPDGHQVVDALGRHGIAVRRLEVADVRARNSSPWFATTLDGDEVFVKVVGPEEHAADLLYRAFRAVRLKDTGDAPPFSSVRREVEHEAALALSAWAGGVRTPKLLATGEVGVDSMMLAFRSVRGEPFDGSRTVDDETLTDLWRQVAVLHDRRIAHRNLSRSNVVVDDAGEIWLTDFGFAEFAADSRQLDADVAQLLVSTAMVAGADRAVDTALAVVGPARLARAAGRLQPAALGSSTRAALDGHPELLAQLRERVSAETGTEPPELERLERITTKSLLTVAMLGLAFYFLIPQLAQVRLDDITEADWAWFPLIVAFSLLTYVGATVALLGSIPDRVRFVPTLEAQIGGSFVNRITPVKVGGMATNVRYLQRAGVEPPIAIAGIGLVTVVGFVVHMTLLVVFVTTAGRSATDAVSLPSGQAVLVGLVVVMTLAGVVALIPAGRQLLDRVWPIVKRSVSGIGNVAARPSKVMALLVGSFVVTTAYMLALWYSVVAFGGGIGFVGVGAVYLAGQALAQAAPTPGGIGAAEAALIAGLTAFGLPADVAVPAVFLYRFATFWLPILPGWLAVRHLLRTGAL